MKYFEPVSLFIDGEVAWPTLGKYLLEHPGAGKDELKAYLKDLDAQGHNIEIKK